jgi:uncharacterized protein (DUF1697 family)
MNTFISILRGINVSGHNIIKMGELAEMYRSLGFDNVRTYLQSGNVVFDAAPSSDEISCAEEIINGIKEKFMIDIPVLVKCQEEMKRIASVNPFIKNKNPEIEKLHVTFLAEIPDYERVMLLKNKDFGGERFEIIGREVFLYCPDGYGRARLNNNFFEKTLHCNATTRNWKTVKALAAM